MFQQINIYIKYDHMLFIWDCRTRNEKCNNFYFVFEYFDFAISVLQVKFTLVFLLCWKAYGATSILMTVEDNNDHKLYGISSNIIFISTFMISIHLSEFHRLHRCWLCWHCGLFCHCQSSLLSRVCLFWNISQRHWIRYVWGDRFSLYWMIAWGNGMPLSCIANNISMA